MEIRIKQLKLENFKCHKNLTLAFGGRDASIYGDNATGKTSIYDALVWLLFDKDSNGNGSKNFEIKPMDSNGEVKDHQALTAVEAQLLVDGVEVTLRRTYKEVWSTKRGSSEATYDGNTSEYFVDGVPCKRNAFQEKVNDLVNEETFRLLTSVSHFAAGISWQDRRAVLFQVAGVMDDGMILATDQRFDPLVQAMGRLSIDDYKRKLQAEKKQHTGVGSELPARISECEKTIEDVIGLDFAGAKADLEQLNARMEEANSRMAAIRNNNAVQQKELEVKEAKLSLNALENENLAFRANQSIGKLDTVALTAGLRTMEAQIAAKRRQADNEQGYIDGLNKKVASLREDWVRTNNEEFNGGDCPTCGQRLPAESLKKAKDAFEADKKLRLDAITQRAADHAQAITAAKERLSNLEAEIVRWDADAQNQKKLIAEAEADVKPIFDMEGYAERRKAILDTIEKLAGELFELQADSAASLDVIQQEKNEIQAEIRKHQDTISKESVLDYSKNRIKELRENAQAAAEKLEGIEQMLWLIDEYSRYKTRFVEDSINGLFRIARFRLFREQANGGVEERCDVVHDGVPYNGVNNGMKINLGIDIINTLSRAYGVSVPLFIDNAESVTRLEASASQIVRLVVSENDKELRVNYEN